MISISGGKHFAHQPTARFIAYQEGLTVAKAATKTTAKRRWRGKRPRRRRYQPKRLERPAQPPGAPRRPRPQRRLPKVSKVAKKSTGTSASPILTLRHIAEQLSEAHELPKRQANEMLTQMVETIAKSLKKGDKIRLSGLGILYVRKRAARIGRNPQTGEPIKIKASKKIAFRPARSSRKRSDRQPWQDLRHARRTRIPVGQACCLYAASFRRDAGRGLVHLEHAYLALAAEDSLEFLVSQDLPLVLRVLEILGLDVLPHLAHHLGAGNGEEPTTAASSFEGCSGFIRAGFGFLAAFVPSVILLCLDGVRHRHGKAPLLRCYAQLKPARARRSDHDEERTNRSLPQDWSVDVAQSAASVWDQNKSCSH